MELFRIGDFRISTITKVVSASQHRLTTKQEDIIKGIAVEETNDGKSWYVIAFLKPDEKNAVINIETVDFRIIDAASNDVEAFQDVFYEGRRILMEALVATDEKWKRVYEYDYSQD